MHLISFSILLIQVTAYALPATSLSISKRAGDPESRELKTEKIVLEGKEYYATPLPNGYQGNGQTFKLEGGFQVGGSQPKVPAILKRVLEKEGGNNPKSKTVREIEIMKRPSVGLHLFSQWSRDGDMHQADIVMKDLREQDPPLKPFHEWYQEDKSIYGRIGLGSVEQKLFERLLWYAEYDNLLQNDVYMTNVFIEKQVIVDEELVTDHSSIYPIMPTTWEVDDVSHSSGASIITGIDDRDLQILQFRSAMQIWVEEQFSMEVLASNLKPGGKIRKHDVHFEYFQDEPYKVLRIRAEDKYSVTYKVVGTFEFEDKETHEKVDAKVLLRVRDVRAGGYEDDSSFYLGDLIGEYEDKQRGTVVRLLEDDRKIIPGE